MRVSVFGLGYVGSVTAGCLARCCNDVIGVDIDAHKVDTIRRGASPIREEGLDELLRSMVSAGKIRATSSCEAAINLTDVSLVCVGTPSAEDGRLDLDALLRVCDEIGTAIRRKGRDHLVVIRSTVLPGTTRQQLIPALEAAAHGKAGEAFGIATAPEFLREGTSIQDFFHPPAVIIGADRDREADLVAKLFEPVGVEPIRCAIAEAEAIKYVCNLFHATKITFANEVGLVCRQAKVDARKVMEIACRDKKLNISSRYLRPGFAFGGSCLPKDLRAFSSLARQHNLPDFMLESLLRSNQAQIEDVVRRVMAYGLRRVGLLGLSFKENTDDLRESPLVVLAERLIGHGYELKIFDPNVEYAALYGSNRRYIDRELPHLKKLLCTADEVLEHGQILVVGHGGDKYRDIVQRRQSDQRVLDLVGVDTPAEAGVNHYEGLYW